MAHTFQQAIEANKPLAVPSVYDGISALLIRELGSRPRTWAVTPPARRSTGCPTLATSARG
jgi:2-methylisocitrate lyase-like PEP mutase family enzyme